MKQLLNTLYVTTQGAYLAKDGETVQVRVEQEDAAAGADPHADEHCVFRAGIVQSAVDGDVRGAGSGAGVSDGEWPVSGAGGGAGIRERAAAARAIPAGG